MKIAFVTTQTLAGSTVVGRVLPLAKKLAGTHEVYMFVHESGVELPDEIKIESIGKDPFIRTASGKKRLRGIALIGRMLLNAWQTLLALVHVQPDVAIIVKPLPQNVLAVWLWHLFNSKRRVILDVDDFELTANDLASVYQRATVHWAERSGASISSAIATATPFLEDHFRQLTAAKKHIELLPTPLPLSISRIVSDSSLHTLLYIGSVSRSSGHRVDLLPEILEYVRREIPNVTLTIAGSGDDIEGLKKQFEAKGLTSAVTWLGRFSFNQVPQILSETAVIIDPIDGSIVNRSKSSFRVALAAAVGMPIVTSNIGIRPLLLPEHLHTRFFAQPGDATSYAKQVIDLLESPLSTQDGDSLLARAGQNTPETMAQAYGKLLV
ncbi:MAG: glycosyltransferase [Candidatus Andersenbacteria bacterium]